MRELEMAGEVGEQFYDRAFRLLVEARLKAAHIKTEAA